MNSSSCAFEIIDQTLRSSDNRLTVTELCRIAGASRSGFYAWRDAADVRARREEQDQKDFDLILTAYKMHGYTKGAQGIYMALQHMDPPVTMNLKQVQSLLPDQETEPLPQTGTGFENQQHRRQPSAA